MKKLGVSLVAVLVSLPMMAHADISAITLKGNPAGTVAANTNVATTSYVQGAYNDLAGHINTNVAAINTLNGDASTNGSVAKSISDALTTERTATKTITNTTIDADDNTISDLEVDNFKSGVVATTVRAAGENGADDDHLVTESAVRTAIDAVATTANSAANENLSNLTATGKSNVSAQGTVDLTKNDYGNNTIGKALVEIKATADAALTSSSTLDGANLDTGSVAKTALAQGVQDSLDAADSAVQSVTTGDAVSGNGTIKVDGTAVSVYGLGSAAFVNTNAIAGTSGTFDDTNAQLGTNSIQGAIEAVAASASTANGTKGFNVYGNWATPDTATGHVNVAAESGLQANPQP